MRSQVKKTIKLLASDKDSYKKTAEFLRNGGIAVVPTETVYGFAASAFNISARNLIYKIKGRNYKKPLILMTYALETAKIFVDIPPKALKVTEKFWPGQLTLIFPTTELGKILSGGRDNLGVRIPNNKFMLNLLKEANVPVWTTSANKSRAKSAKTTKDIETFNGIVDVIIDGGKCEFSFESTVIDMVRFPYTIIRNGCLNAKEILKIL
jgi:L-threonylcarbamoyladenylate synthase